MDFKKVSSDKYNDYYIIADGDEIKFYSSWKEAKEPSYSFILSVSKNVLKDAIDSFSVAKFIVDAIKERKDIKESDKKSAVKKYGDVKYGDPRNKKYPIDTKEHILAAWRYINMPKNAKKYSSEDLKTIKGRIKSAAKKMGIKLKD